MQSSTWFPPPELHGPPHGADGNSKKRRKSRWQLSRWGGIAPRGGRWRIPEETRRARKSGKLGAGTAPTPPVRQFCAYVHSCCETRFSLDRARSLSLRERPIGGPRGGERRRSEAGFVQKGDVALVTASKRSCADFAAWTMRGNTSSCPPAGAECTWPPSGQPISTPHRAFALTKTGTYLSGHQRDLFPASNEFDCRKASHFLYNS